MDRRLAIVFFFTVKPYKQLCHVFNAYIVLTSFSEPHSTHLELLLFWHLILAPQWLHLMLVLFYFCIVNTFLKNFIYYYYFGKTID